MVEQRRSPVYEDRAGEPVVVGWIEWPESASAEVAETLRLSGEAEAGKLIERLLSGNPIVPIDAVRKFV